MDLASGVRLAEVVRYVFGTVFIDIPALVVFVARFLAQGNQKDTSRQVSVGVYRSGCNQQVEVP
jgi:hypothetical protein